MLSTAERKLWSTPDDRYDRLPEAVEGRFLGVTFVCCQREPYEHKLIQGPAVEAEAGSFMR